MKRFSTANWQGTGKEGKGYLTTESSIIDKGQYNYIGRFENGLGTNPEELIAAAHAGCFSMKLSFLITDAGFTPGSIDTKCDITFDTEKGIISLSHLTVKARVVGLGKEKFDELTINAKENCPVSKLLNTIVTLEAILE